jgi:hypothetical protein
MALTFAALLAAAGAEATIIQLNFTDDTAVRTGQIGSSGYWTSVDGGTTGTGNVADLIDNANTSTGISLTWGSLSGYQNAGRGENGTGVAGTANDGLSTWTAAAAAKDPNSGVTTADGKFFPWSVVGTFSADNRDSGRDSLMSFTFASDTQLTYSFWVASSYDHNNPAAANFVGLFNVGGTYDYNTGFTGGATLTLASAYQQASSDTILDSSETSPGSVKYQVGRLGTTFPSVYNEGSGKYELTFQAGAAKVNTPGVYLNGLIVEAIPEPASAGIFALGVAVVLLHRRVRG